MCTNSLFFHRTATLSCPLPLLDLVGHFCLYIDRFNLGGSLGYRHFTLHGNHSVERCSSKYKCCKFTFPSPSLFSLTRFIVGNLLLARWIHYNRQSTFTSGCFCLFRKSDFTHDSASSFTRYTCSQYRLFPDNLPVFFTQCSYRGLCWYLSGCWSCPGC